MTLREAIAQADELKPNAYSVKEKVRWLTRLDQRIAEDILKTQAAVYTEMDLDKPLMVKSPYDEVYILYMMMQIDFYNAEYGRYNNDAVSFNALYSEYADYCNRKRQERCTIRITV